MKNVVNLLVLLCVFFVLFPAGLRSQAPAIDLRAQGRGVLAQTSGTIEAKGLRKRVRVLRDEWGIPHIYAETQDDLFFAQGFVAAQDRLWQMDLWRRIGEGKLAEVLGERAIERDRFARLLRYRGDMKAEYESYAPDAKSIIEAFVRGVNASIEASRDRLPIEFQLAGYRPEPWTPEVCLTRMAGYVMTRNASTEILRAQLVREYGREFVDEWIETEPARRVELPAGLDLEGIDGRILAAANAAGGPVTFNPSDGSNNWVIDGTMSSTGKPLLANDPHRTIALPSLRYLVHLNGPGWNVIGAGEPTLPGVAAGHNERVGFGFTIVGIDQQDLYVEETNPANPNEYRWQGAWRRMRVEREPLTVKGEPTPRMLELKFTHHGPVIYEDPARHRAYALKWVGSEPGTAGYLASLTLNRVQNWEQFLKAMERWKTPSENLIYADVDGNIGWVAAGITPVRRGPSGKSWSGLLPVPGSEGKYEWQGFLPTAKLPRRYNPSDHFIATANHNILPADYPHELGYEWANPIRFRRIAEALGAPGRKFGVADFERLQYDELSLPARELTAVLREVREVEPELRPYVELLTQWDCRLSRDAAAAALFEVWVTRLSAAVFKPHVPAKAWGIVGGRVPLLKTIDALKRPSARWFGEAAQAGRDRAMRESLKEAVAETRRLLGEDAKRWRWGRLHTASFTHPLATTAERRAVFNLPSVEKGGDGNTVNNTSGPNFRQNHGASFREILDVSDWDNSVATSVPGQSGQPGSPHYGDLLSMWAEGRYFPLLYSRQKVEAKVKQQLILEPRK
ncbi:MAG: penicillin acylase family protein [Blastocatellia bacterium]|nr:penicillin acylase family protein [Blastocatellia bacterium]